MVNSVGVVVEESRLIYYIHSQNPLIWLLNV